MTKSPSSVERIGGSRRIWEGWREECRGVVSGSECAGTCLGGSRRSERVGGRRPCPPPLRDFGLFPCRATLRERSRGLRQISTAHLPEAGLVEVDLLFHILLSRLFTPLARRPSTTAAYDTTIESVYDTTTSWREKELHVQATKQPSLHVFLILSCCSAPFAPSLPSKRKSRLSFSRRRGVRMRTKRRAM
jgi:hypothetical protein